MSAVLDEPSMDDAGMDPDDASGVRPGVQGRMMGIVPCAWLLALMVPVHAQSAPVLADRPPMGWNSFDSYGVYLHEQAALANIEAMARLLKPHGYEYFVVDNGWFGEYRLRPDGLHPAEKHAHEVRLDGYGRVLPSTTYFPHGFEPLVKRCRELGLKFGVHLMRGIPRKAYEENLPIAGTSYHARDIANTAAAANCTWCTYNYAVDMTRPGAQEWYDGLIRHIVDMGAEVIKYDDIVPYPAEVAAVAKAITRTGRPVLLSLSPGGEVATDAIATFQQANMLRVTADIWDNLKGLDEAFAAWRKWSGHGRPGFWIDMDMVPFGQLQLMSPPDGAAGDEKSVALAGLGSTRWCRFSQAQKETFITLRALAASPLMVGGDLPTMDSDSLRLLIEPEMIACNQNGVMGHLVGAADGIEVWQTPKRGSDDHTGWIGVFNRTPLAQAVALSRERLGLAGGRPGRLVDIWNGQRVHQVGDAPVTATIAPDGVLFFRFR